MAIDVENSMGLSRLWSAIKRSRDTMAAFDNDRTEMLRDYAGPLYSRYSSRRRNRYVNKLNTTATIYQTALCFNNPRCKITSFNQELWPFCRKWEASINRVAANMELRATLQECVMDAFFLLGAAKVHLTDSGEERETYGEWLDLGKIRVGRIPFSDLILDMPGRSLRSQRFYGDRYRCSFDTVMARDDFEKSVKSKMSPSSKQNQNVDSDRADRIGCGSEVDDDELEPGCWLMDLYLPREKKFVTLAADHQGLPPLKVRNCKDTEHPYKFLALGYMPDNVLPSTPAQQLVLLDRLMNRLYSKLAEQANQQKNFHMVQRGAEKDGEVHKNAKNGEYVLVSDPKSVVTASTPGVDGQNAAFYLAAGEIYNTQSGNERMLGGLGTEADTATQEQMLSNATSGRMAFMKGAVNDFVSEILREIGMLLWEDENMTVENTIEAEHTGYYVPPELASWKPGDREGAPDHYDFAVEPNSMIFRPPEAKLATLKQFAIDYLQMLPAIQAGAFDGEAFTAIYAEYTNTPEILKLAKQIDMEQGMADPHQATKAPVTERNVTRNNVSNGPQGQGMAAVMSQMMQGNKQPAMAGAAR
jgi:hypothetical protein